ncbi:MAG: hypothetical protein E7493_07080 [Ruminococcus albus]|nr:hypothetical protein [Ruminococcus albus]
MKKIKPIYKFFICVITCIFIFVFGTRLIFGAFPIIYIDGERYWLYSSEVILKPYILDQKELDKISHFVRLKSLSVGTYRTDLSCLNGMTGLEKLNLDFTSSDVRVVDFEKLENFPDLKFFSIVSNNFDGSYIERSKDLEVLYINSNVAVNSEKIWNCRKLKEVVIHVRSGEFSFAGVSKLDDLEFLVISDHDVDETEKASITGTSELSKCKNLSKLVLLCDIDDHSFLNDMPALKELTVYEGALSADIEKTLKAKGVEIDYNKHDDKKF